MNIDQNIAMQNSAYIVANETEIGKWQLECDPELQTMIAMNPLVRIEEPKKRILL